MVLVHTSIESGYGKINTRKHRTIIASEWMTIIGMNRVSFMFYVGLEGLLGFVPFFPRNTVLDSLNADVHFRKRNFAVVERYVHVL